VRALEQIQVADGRGTMSPRWTSGLRGWRRTRLSFRAANEAIEGNRGDGGRGERKLTFLCECGIQTRFERIAITPDYEAVGSHPARFVVAPEHVEPLHRVREAWRGADDRRAQRSATVT